MGFAEAWKKTQTTEENPVVTPDPAPRTPDVCHAGQKNLTPIGVTIPANESQARPGDDWYDDRICMAIEELNDAGIRYTDATEEDRTRAMMLELEYTHWANADDMPRFWKALREWKAVWIKELH